MRLKKKFESGAATNYISRGRAIKKLQLTLKDFKRLCILKGIYPHEPAHKKKVNKGSTENRVFYYVKDINFLASEPIIQKFRDYKVFLRKLKSAKAKHEGDQVRRLFANRPEYHLDSIIKERYPTFASSLRDLDDVLCLCFAFATLPHTRIIKPKIVEACRRLTAEFNHYIIHSQTLTKVFISIKGIYYQAEIMGERITWVVGHDRGVGHVTGVDFSVMATFTEFYVSMLGFVNYRLYQLSGLFYPPQILFPTVAVSMKKDDESEKVYCLAHSLAERIAADFETLPDLSIGEDDMVESDFALRLNEMVKKKSLFKNCKFWLNRETPKDMLTIIIRSCGGSVSWENCPGSLYNETDPSISHGIIDRPQVTQTDINRMYIQPQWVVDCFNSRRLLPYANYSPGAILPPHLSPFVDSGDLTEYDPVTYTRKISNNEAVIEETAVVDCNLNVTKGTTSSNEKGPSISFRVEEGRTHKENLQRSINEKGHELKLREMMILKKYKRVYEKIKRGKKRKARETAILEQKRAKLALKQ